MAGWNPWHGCHRISPGCANCYVFRFDEKFDRDPEAVRKTADFNQPARRKRDGTMRLQGPDTVYTCFSSDFFLEDADEWRIEAWQMIRQRSDLHFFIITKRIHRFAVNLPDDWGDGYENVTICSTCENQDRAAFRLPILLQSPIRHRRIICEPLLGPIDLSPWLTPEIEGVIVGGESGSAARPCDYEWVKELRRQCVAHRVPFHFKQTGACFVKDGRLYRIPRPQQQPQAARAGIDWPSQADITSVSSSNLHETLQ